MGQFVVFEKRSTHMWIFFAAVLILLVPFMIPKAVLYALGAFGVTPNIISIKGLVAGWLGILALWMEMYEVGFLLMFCSFSLDILDGLWARAIPNDASPSGKWIDPLCDKLKIIPLFCFLSWKGILIWWVVLPLVVLEVYGILSRPPFRNITIKLDGGERVHIASTSWGKAKHHVQVIAFVCTYVVLARFTEAMILWQTVANFLVLASVILAVRSIISRMARSTSDRE